MNLQECLDVIGYTGTPQVNVQDMEVIFEKFCKKIPFSTVHSDGQLKAYSGTDFYDRVITQQVGGVCMELAYVLDYILSEIGFTTTYAGFSPVPENGMLVKVSINNEDWILNPSSRATGLCKPIKLSQDYLIGDHKMAYTGSWEVQKWDGTQWAKAFGVDPTDRAFIYWQASYEARSQAPSDVTVQNDIISTVIDSGTVMYFNGTITARTIEGSTEEAYTNQDLIDLFNYHGTV